MEIPLRALRTPFYLLYDISFRTGKAIGLPDATYKDR